MRSFSNLVGRVLRSWAVGVAISSTAAHAAIPPTISAASWLVLDGDSGRVLAEYNADQRRDPASLTKLLTAYVVFDAIKRNALSWDESVAVSASEVSQVAGDEARMYLRAGQLAKVKDLLRGLIVASANDAALVLADRVGSNTTGFAKLMNDSARHLGMKDSHFISPSGISTPNHYTTARDLSLLALRLTADFPEYYAYSSQQEFSYGDFSKKNKNALLVLDPSVDGLKTGHTKAAGWCIVATATRKQAGSRTSHRVFAVVLGAPTDKQRISAAQSLIQYGYSLLENTSSGKTGPSFIN